MNKTATVIMWMKEYALILLLTAGTIYTFFRMMKLFKDWKITWYMAVPAAMLHTLWGVICVKSFAFMESGFDINTVRNMSLFGGVFFMPVYYFCFSKIFHLNTKVVFDSCTNCMLFTLLCARINCIVSGCCKGRLIGLGSMRWPTREAEIIFYIMLLMIIRKRLKKGIINGKIYPCYMMTYSVFRFFLEWFRYYDVTSRIHIAHIWALISFCLSASIFTEIQAKERR